MAILDFEHMPRVVSEAREQDLRGEGSYSLLFEMLVRFSVGGVEIFRLPQELGGRACAWVQLHEFAAYGGLALRAAAREGHARYNFIDTADHVDFQVEGDQVAVSSTMQPSPGRAGYHEIEAAWRAFENRVRAYLLQETPELAQNPFWGAWLRGARVEDLPPYFGPREGETGPLEH